MGTIRHAFNGTSNQEVSYQLLYSSYSKYDEDWGSYPHTHYFTELFYVLDGSGSFLVEEESFPICQQDLIIVNSNILHTEISNRKSPLEYIVLGVEGLNFLICDDKEYLTLHCHSIKENLNFYFHTILNEMGAQKKDSGKVCQNLLEAFIIQLSRQIDSPVAIPSQKKATRECSRAKRYLDSNYHKSICLDTLANLIHLNKYYLAHTFREVYGTSPMNYLTQKRIFTSQELLTSTDMNLPEISQQCGFSSSSYFSQCFRKTCGLTPTEYRRQFKKY